MFVYLIDNVNGSVRTFPQLLCSCHVFVQNTLVVAYLCLTLGLSHTLKSLSIWTRGKNKELGGSKQRNEIPF